MWAIHPQKVKKKNLHKNEKKKSRPSSLVLIFIVMLRIDKTNFEFWML